MILYEKDLPKLKNEKLIQDILDNFEFDKVHQTMKALDWKWWDCGVPTVDILREKAEELLVRICEEEEEKYFIGTGGFVVEKDGDLLELRFEVCSVDSTWFTDN